MRSRIHAKGNCHGLIAAAGAWLGGRFDSSRPPGATQWKVAVLHLLKKKQARI